MVRSKLQNGFNKSRTSENWEKYKQQRNKCLSIFNNCFNNLNPRVITDNKKFWSVAKPLLSDKSKAMKTIVLYEKGKIIKNYKKVPEVLNKYFTNLAKSLKGVLSGLRQLLTFESPLNMMKNAFYFT